MLDGPSAPDIPAPPPMPEPLNTDAEDEAAARRLAALEASRRGRQSFRVDPGPRPDTGIRIPRG